MRQQDHLATFVGDFGDGRLDALDASRVGDAAAIHRHVEVDAKEDALVGDVSLIESAKAGHVYCHNSEASLIGDGGLVSASDLIFSPLRENANATPKNASTINPYKTQTMTRAYCLPVGAQISFPIATAVSIMRL